MSKKKVNVLIIDHDEDVRIIVSKWLEDLGYKVFKANSGKESEDLLNKELNIIFIDVMLQDVPTVFLLEQIKKKAPNAIVIYLTSIDPFDKKPIHDKKEWDIIFEPPVMGYLKKPVNKEELLEEIKDALKMLKLVS